MNIEDLNIPTFYLYFGVGLISLFVGSFLNVVIYRLPKMLEEEWRSECRLFLGLAPKSRVKPFNLSLPFSHCPTCKKNIPPKYNIPIVSYFFLKGKCAYCKAKISARYPFIEALTLVLSLLIVWQFGINATCIAVLFYTWICITLTFIDFDFHLLPDQLTLLLLWLGLYFSTLHIFTSPENAILGAIAGYCFFALTELTFKLFTGKTGLGQGDFKLLAAIGAFLGWQLLPMVILASSLLGIAYAVGRMVLKKEYRSIPLPFGPFLAIAGWIGLIWGEKIINLYLNVSSRVI